jgi:hypothetical protein
MLQAGALQPAVYRSLRQLTRRCTVARAPQT